MYWHGLSIDLWAAKMALELQHYYGQPKTNTTTSNH